MRPRAEAGRQRRVHQHQTGHRLGVPRRLHGGDQAAHRVADQDRGRAGDLGQEAVQQLLVGLDRGGVAASLGEAEPGQVEGQHPAGGGEQGGQGRPVDQRAAEPVHADEQRAVGRAAVVDVVHPAAEVGPPGLRPGERVRRARRALRRRRLGGGAVRLAHAQTVSPRAVGHRHPGQDRDRAASPSSRLTRGRPAQRLAGAALVEPVRGGQLLGEEPGHRRVARPAAPGTASRPPHTAPTAAPAARRRHPARRGRRHARRRGRCRRQISATGRGSPLETTRASPCARSQRSSGGQDGVDGVVDVGACRSGRRRSRPAAAARPGRAATSRATSWVSPGPTPGAGGRATTARPGASAASASRSATALVRA